jgi:hypothetical protein
VAVASTPFEAVASGLRLPPEAAVWVHGWEASQACYPQPVPGFLTPAGLNANADWAGLSTELRSVFLGALPGLTCDERLCRLLWHLYRRLFFAPGMLQENLAAWPLLPASAMPQADLFHAYAYLAGAEVYAARCAERGIPREVVRATLADFELWVREHRAKAGQWGLSNLRWLSNHFSGNLFQLGRLQFQFGTFRYPYHAWRQCGSGRVRLLAESSVRFSADGSVAGTAPELPLGAPYSVSATAVCGLPIEPRGHALAGPESLPLAEWTRILSPGDPVLNLHIPAGSPMDVGLCGESFRQAGAFYATHFPEYRYRAYACGSWLLDPQFEQVLKPSSNIVRFLKEVYLFPLPGATGRQTIERAFGTAEIEPATAPRDTSLRRAVIEHLERGGVWRAGGCVLFPEEAAEWGRQPYRR